MHDLLEILGLMFRYAIGLGIFALLMFLALRAIAQPWRKVADHYAGQPSSGHFPRRFPETMVITGRVERGAATGGRKDWRTYAAVRMDVHDNCLTLSMVFPFNIMCPPLLLPTQEMELADSWWPSLTNPVAIRMERAPDVDMIIRGSAAEWLRTALATVPTGHEHVRFAHTPARKSLNRQS